MEDVLFRFKTLTHRAKVIVPVENMPAGEAKNHNILMQGCKF